MHKLTLAVDGMRCRRCVREATALVRDVDGVHAVVADPDSGLITVLGTMTGERVLASLRGTDFATRIVADQSAADEAHVEQAGHTHPPQIGEEPDTSA